MQQAELDIGTPDREQEAARLAALVATGIMDSPPESSYDAITRLAAEYFQADSAALGFVDESRIWIKSSWGQHVRELPRKNSIFELVLGQGRLAVKCVWFNGGYLKDKFQAGQTVAVYGKVEPSRSTRATWRVTLSGCRNRSRATRFVPPVRIARSSRSIPSCSPAPATIKINSASIRPIFRSLPTLRRRCHTSSRR